MYNNMGKKLKSVAELFTAWGYIISIIGAIIFFFVGCYNENSVLVGCSVAGGIIGCIVSWFSNALLAAFAELIINTTVIIGQLKDISISQAKTYEAVKELQTYIIKPDSKEL